MERLTDFKPLEKVFLPGIGELNCSGLIVVVGPNSSGKSQFLRDVFLRLRGEPRDLVVATDVTIAKPEWDPFVNCLEREGYFRTRIDVEGRKKWVPQTHYIGEGGISEMDADMGRPMYDKFKWNSEAARLRPNEFLSYYGRLLVTGLLLDRRLNALNRVGLIDFVEGLPQNDLQALHMDSKVRSALFEEVRQSFGVGVWPDTSRGVGLMLKVSDAGVLPTDTDRLDVKEMAKYREIESEGDGLKSYVAIALALLLGRRPVCIIDEPEMCLHPPQAYNLGRFIGRHGDSSETVTLVATHSSHVLRGVIQTSKNIQVVRMTRDLGSFTAHLVPPETLTEALAKPTLRAEAVLDGIFAKSVVIVEADGDRLVYQTTSETLADEIEADIHFATAGGTGGIADTCRLYKTLSIPVAVIADLDMVADSDKLGRVLAALTEPSTAETLRNRAAAVTTRIKALPPTVTEKEVRDKLTAILDSNLDWEGGGDVDVKNRLAQLRNQLDRLRRLKSGGIPAFGGQIAKDLKSIVGDLATVGLFLVPNGELEEWLKNEDLGVSKGSKWAWANAAALKIQEKGRTTGDVWDFMRGVGTYLNPSQASAEKAASAS